MHYQRSRTTGDILIVDDDPTIVEMLTELLLFEGYQVRSGRDGHEALAAIMIKRPALVLLDLQMPGMNGAEVIDALAETPFADLQIAIITATPAAAEPLVGRSNVACMAKPLDIDALLAGVAEALRLADLES
ncbi:MAG: response regulator [Chloroflexota bacterium]|nr:response regulator [Chloroflexota bacterium]